MRRRIGPAAPIAIGDRVRHPYYGVGTVIDAYRALAWLGGCWSRATQPHVNVHFDAGADVCMVTSEVEIA